MAIKVEDIEFVRSSRFLPECVVVRVMHKGQLLHLVVDPENFSVDRSANSGVFLEEDELVALNLAISRYANDNDIDPLLSCSVLYDLVEELSGISGERYRLDEIWGGGFELRQMKKGAFWHVASYHSSSLAYCGLKEMIFSLE